MRNLVDLNMEDAVEYHYGSFPPASIDALKIIDPLAEAAAALARYDQMLKGMHNSEILLAPLRSQEAVVSSRMEGTVSTLDEVLRYEADHEDGESEALTDYRSEAVEVALYGRAMRHAQKKVDEGVPISDWLVRAAHKELLQFGRGALSAPGQYKTEQNYIVDRMRRSVLFVPVRPEHLQDGMSALFKYIGTSEHQLLIRTAMAHLEFEALHPFKDGNGRIGRMLITLMLWKHGAISAPHFYASAYFEEHRDEYIDRMREVSKNGAWTEWTVFFLRGLSAQAHSNLEKAEGIRILYEEMKDAFREVLSSQWSTSALDFVFGRPIFRNNTFTSRSGIPKPTAHRFTRTLLERGFLKIVAPAAGRRPAVYAFEPLLDLLRE
ncbi:Fic/DOC family N-terminal domain-containing protein [uncultured Thalassospira sp.]|uniref:Fic family protein n=1 Tax=uncultured Thalassospira sp. TaxID=404382 RepID=UPI002597E346|nr:Fic/DOC family N-terminal domain-containing protein [uncultured Thalassospira sp.]